MNNNLDKLLERFRIASRMYSDASVLMHETIARKAGLMGSDHKYLGLILQHKELTAGEVSNLTGLTKGAVTGLLDRLEAKGLLHRKLTKDDRRKIIIVPDFENSMKLLQPFFNDLQERTTPVISSFSEEEIQVIERYFLLAANVMKDFTETLKK
ncbi:MarR family winged helix-turn-helix transcriptional regulator [Chryseobacterium oranimense]|uniref:DNA-binding transcriptional regulator, MarR family n=1 Tax=Chryseobacterium oranimense TaxID=421058 RepID=A0A1M5JJH3_9FLAO|nr:helix-turn-helix domain-containing protein [Chryseobacterium oranimense]CEJ69000.1 HTH-type transcriptional regulator MhqR [Chryseobacterium oranimense G311]SHG40724.1 DNA-binding transcriptional regulator, MarR family [Chryseobacterium oranimense]